jgi:hypothetical protein
MRVKAYANDQGTSVPTLYRLANLGKVKFDKLGRSTLVDVEASDPYFDSLPRADIKTNPHPSRKRAVTT